MFTAACAPQWIVATVAPDYGLDLRVELARGEAVTGEEFLVQVKGHHRLRPRRAGGVALRVSASSINYWLGKLEPVMIVAVDTTRSRIWHAWLQHAFSDYPNYAVGDSDIELILKRELDNSFQRETAIYVGEWFARFRADVRALSDGVSLSRLLLHAAGIARTLARIHLTLTSGRSAQDIEDPMFWLFQEFGAHDQFLFSLFEPTSVWHQPLSSSVATVVRSKLARYVEESSHFWMRNHQVTKGDFQLIPFSYTALKTFLLPALESAWDLEDTLHQLVVLGHPIGTPPRTGA